MVYEAATHDWQPVPKKHTSNRQPKISSVLAALALRKGKSAAAVGTVSGGTDLSVLDSNAVGSERVMGGVGLNGQLVGADPQIPGAAGSSL
ncbi:hypothetical protein OIU79_022123 [Salix purpurea]|uniref:Uncharacterized protein n=1 Tax=Salix purpurea TaxID=77065 RepID=A0A9Q1ACG1_SALPP|nr:hypothetical protein OIU79_022123 [Salix purpurea]